MWVFITCEMAALTPGQVEEHPALLGCDVHGVGERGGLAAAPPPVQDVPDSRQVVTRCVHELAQFQPRLPNHEAHLPKRFCLKEHNRLSNLC